VTFPVEALDEDGRGGVVVAPRDSVEANGRAGRAGLADGHRRGLVAEVRRRVHEVPQRRRRGDRAAELVS
jgi:hypothetical protein